MLRAYETRKQMIESARTESAAQTMEVGARAAARLRGGELVLLGGSLGAGKSTLAAGVGRALGVERWRGSPTFALIHEYPTRPELVHVDLYRLEATDVEDLGLEEYVDAGAILLVEWPERAVDYLLALRASRVLDIQLDIIGEAERQITIVELEPMAGR
jgi:tRNA threonylcarbamoyladenosine biosynthesis protein TsaE